MRAPCRSILGALVFVKCGFLGSLSVAAYKMRACVRTCMRVYVCTYIHNVQWRHGSALSIGRSFTLIHLHVSRAHNAVEAVITGGEWMLVWGVIVFPIAQSSTYILAMCYLHTLWQRKLYVG